MSSFDATLQLTAYTPALAALATLCLAVLVQSFLTAPLAFIGEEQVPGMPLRGDHTLLSFRVLRTYANSVENLPVFATSLLLAALVGVSPWLVNGLAVVHVASRLAFWGVYYRGAGKIAGGPRSMIYVLGALSNIVLACAVIFALFV